jgi:hypothetical protein
MYRYYSSTAVLHNTAVVGLLSTAITNMEAAMLVFPRISSISSDLVIAGRIWPDTVCEEKSWSLTSRDEISSREVSDRLFFDADKFSN